MKARTQMTTKGKLVLCAAAVAMSVLVFFMTRKSDHPEPSATSWNDVTLDSDIQVYEHSNLQATSNGRESKRGAPHQLELADLRRQANESSSYPSHLVASAQNHEPSVQDVAGRGVRSHQSGIGNTRIIKNQFINEPIRQANLEPNTNDWQATPSLDSRDARPTDRPSNTTVYAEENLTVLDQVLLDSPSTPNRSHPSLPQQFSVLSHQITAPPVNVQNVVTETSENISEPILHAPNGNGMQLAPPANQGSNSYRTGSEPARFKAKLTPAVAQQVLQQVEYGKTLARRGAAYAARDEFVSALRLVSETLDQQSGRRQYSIALADGFTALDEAEDFLSSNDQSHAMLQISRIAKNHRCKVLKIESCDSMTPQEAMQAYYGYAENRLIEACGGHELAASAYHALGKSFALPTETDGTSSTLGLPKSMIMYRIAVSVAPLDHQSRNELAVLLAKNGQLENAKQHLLTSLRTQQTPAAWHNLTMVHNALGEHDLASKAQDQFLTTRNRMAANPDSHPVRWVSPQQLEALAPSPTSDAQMQTRTAQQIQSPTQNSETKKSGWLKPLKDWF